MKYASLIVSLLVGYVIGNVVAGLLASMLTVGHALSPGLRIPLGLGGGLLGTLVGWARWKNRSTPADIPDIHGSAAWASDKDVRSAYGTAAGLVVGRENTKAGALLRYDGPARRRKRAQAQEKSGAKYGAFSSAEPRVTRARARPNASAGGEGPGRGGEHAADRLPGAGPAEAGREFRTAVGGPCPTLTRFPYPPVGLTEPNDGTGRLN